MDSVLSLKMLAVLALVLLVSSMNEGRVLSKCELKAQLDAAQFQVIKAMGNDMTVEDLIARLVCKANASAFNTSFVKTINNFVQVPPQRPPQGPPAAWHQFGLFQLSDQVACDSGLVPSLNVCKMSCTALTDDDITDDVACLKTLINSVKPKPKDKPSNITLPLYTLHALLVKECRHVVPSQYFAECV